MTENADIAGLDRPAGFRGVFRVDPEARAVYAEAAGIQRIWPAAIAVPADPLDVVTLVEWAAGTGTALVPRGSGSSMAGGAVGSGVIVDLSRLRALGPIEVEQRRILVGPGALCGEVDAAAAQLGLRFPVDPSSAMFCTVAGMAATNAAGAHTLKYGSMRAWVMALDCVFSDGSRAVVRRDEPLSAATRQIPAIRRFLSDVAPTVPSMNVESLRHAGVRKESSGYASAEYARTGELVDLLVGSEGTLAIFVGVELALTPRPVATASLLAAYDSIDGAVVGAAAARDFGAGACELLDRTFLDIAREGLGRGQQHAHTDTSSHGDAAGATVRALPNDCDAVLLIELEADDAGEAGERAGSLARTLSAAGATSVTVALERAAETALWALRHAASPALARLDPALKSVQVIEDGCVPPARLADYVRGVRAALARHRFRAAIFGHAGDAHVHVNPLIDMREPTWRARLETLLADVTALTAELGGTLTGEHGDGRLRAPLLPAVWGGPTSPALRLFAAVKSAFDPDGLLNPGVKIATTGEQPIGDVKYDPALLPLPPGARRALDLVADRRAYAQSRLTLLEDVRTI